MMGALLLGAVAMAGCSTMHKSMSNTVGFMANLDGSAEVPPSNAPGTGTIEAAFNKDTNVLTWKITYSNLNGPLTGAHFHGPADAKSNAGIVVPLTGDLLSPLEGKATLTPAQAADLLAGKWYINLHTKTHPAGAIRAQLVPR
jgi:hypothetical protein